MGHSHDFDMVDRDAVNDSKGSLQELAQICFRVFGYPPSAARHAGELLGSAQQPRDNFLCAFGVTPRQCKFRSLSAVLGPPASSKLRIP